MRLNCTYLTLLGLTIIATPSAFGQDCDVNTISRKTSINSSRPNEVIVKFRQSSGVEMHRSRSGASSLSTTNAKAVENTFKQLGIREVTPLMPLTGGEVYGRSRTSYSGQEVETQPMNNAYVVKLESDNVSVIDAVKALEELNEVEYAEPNYLVYALEAETPDDPYYTLQYGVNDINLQYLWGMPILSKQGPVIAILDTGVDITHPDLAANIWTNTKETNGAYSYDDDMNGFTDDLHGWDFVNQTGDIHDFNGHGTHCAGIAAACGNNGIGIIGANPHARIMPITVMQSNGQGDIATIIKGLDYAVANGATVISMSLGTYSASKAFEEALGRAYQKAVLVGAAGNDGLCLNHPHPERGQLAPAPMFPAAYSFVLGVQASSPDGGRASFSNYDDNGPTFSEYGEEELYNYELTVPGVSITSTYPGGGYKELNGTSMATPLVAGAVSRLLQSKEYSNREELFGDLINSVTSKGNLDIYAAYNIKEQNRKPEIQFVTFEMDDADGDGRADAGETVAFYPVIRNSWGNARNICIKVECGEIVNNSFDIIDGTAEFGLNLSSYAKGKSANPLKIKFNKDVTDGRIIRLKFTAQADNAQPIEQMLDITVENAVELQGILTSDMTLYPEQHYVVTNTFGVPAERTLTIMPGTTIKFRDGANFQVYGTIIANGTPDKLIRFTKADLSQGEIKELNFGRNDLSYCAISDLDFQFHSNSGDAAIKSGGKFTNCIFSNLSCNSEIFSDPIKIEKSQIYNLQAKMYGLKHNNYNEASFIKSNFVNSQIKAYTKYTGIMATDFIGCNVFNNYYADDRGNSTFSFQTKGYMDILTPEIPNYLGSFDMSIVRNNVIDINHRLSSEFEAYMQYDFSNLPDRPNPEAPGIVWKVLVNGYDTQDQFEDMPALGIGTHKFDVYFNRPMNKSVTPTVAMGVRVPYTQIAIGENGSWNDTGDIYTAYLTISGKTSIDGLNRIYVADAQDNEYFPIPVEDSRFNVMVQAAGAMSDGFMAEAALGRVNLEWENTEKNFDDMLGLNMYRYEIDADGQTSDTICINKQLIEPAVTKITDYSVQPRKTYCYYYKVMRTDLSETSPSKTVAVTPLTATPGDANGSGSVDVADVVTTVNYASGLNPQPFIFEAADMNGDKEIDILDVVSIIRSILSPASISSMSADATAYYYIDEDGVLYIDTPESLGGVQLNLNMTADGCVAGSPALTGFEQIGARVNDDEYIFLTYNTSGKCIEPGVHAIANLKDANIGSITLSDATGRNIEVSAKDNGTTGIEDIKVDNTYGSGIYNVMGIKLSDNIESLEKLPRGLYIVNGQKVVK